MKGGKRQSRSNRAVVKDPGDNNSNNGAGTLCM